MAIFYRAIWSDQSSAIIGRVSDAFAGWVQEKSRGQLLLSEPEATAADGRMQVRCQHERTSDENAQVVASFYASFVENRIDGTRWSTTVRSWEEGRAGKTDGVHQGWVWVDVEAVSHDSLDQIAVAAPKFVPPLLAESAPSTRLSVPLGSSARLFTGPEGAEELAELVTAEDRDVPMVVFAPLPEKFVASGLPPGMTAQSFFTQVIERAARNAAGLALVCQLDDAATHAFSAIMGEAYDVRDGAFRIYLPGVDPALDESWKHRYTVPARFMRYRNTAGALITRAIAARAGARRAPSSYEAARQLLSDARARTEEEHAAFLQLAYEELDEQRGEIANLDQRYRISLDEQQRLEEENNRLRGELHRATRKLALVEPALWRDQSATMTKLETDVLPTVASSPSEAAQFAQQYLSDFLNFPAEVCMDMQDIDTATESSVWGEASWHAFRALHAYGEALNSVKDPGSFWTWCENSKHPFSWHAHHKKLAMTESESIKNRRNSKGGSLWKRIFPVDKRMDESGEVFMYAHIKIAEGGGMLAPRIYFIPSTKTGQVHVGYFGPHKNVPNTMK